MLINTKFHVTMGIRFLTAKITLIALTVVTIFPRSGIIVWARTLEKSVIRATRKRQLIANSSPARRRRVANGVASLSRRCRIAL